MARGHWLDPLARSLLEVTGQLPRRPKPAEAMAVDATAADDPVERDLLELKLRQDPQRRLHDPSEVRLAAALGWRLDVNRASADDWLRLRHEKAMTAEAVVRLAEAAHAVGRGVAPKVFPP